MKFRLIYKGSLAGNNAPSSAKHEIRKEIHPQMKDLWAHKILEFQKKILEDGAEDSTVIDRGPCKFVPLINKKMCLRADLEILLLRPMDPGSVIGAHGDLDNQIKTLIDGLRVPDKRGYLTGEEYPFEGPVYTLFEDDSLLSGLSVSTGRLLGESQKNKTLAVITVNVVGSLSTTGNIGLISNTVV